MKGHNTRTGCPKAKKGPLQRQRFLTELHQKHQGSVQVFVTSAEEVPTDAEKAEELGFKICVVTVDEGKAAGDNLAVLILGEDGKVVHNLANAFKNRKKAGRWTRMARCAWRAVVVISDRPWVQKAAEKLLVSWVSGWGKQHCKVD